MQPRYNLLFREFERELFPLCLEEGIGVIPYNPLAGGMLSGKHDAVASRRPRARASRWATRRRITRSATGTTTCSTRSTRFVSVAADAGIPLPTLAVALDAQPPAITAPIVGASRPEQLDATLAAVETPLPNDVLERLDELTQDYRRGDSER